MQDNSSVTINSLSIGYRGKRHNHTIASNICGTIEGEKLTCLLGNNGTGKSTLLKTLSGILPPLQGDIFINGIDYKALSPKERARLIGVVLTERPDVTNMRVSEMVAMGRSPYTGFWGSLGADDKHIVDEAMHMTSITALADRRFITLSDGERQKVMIAKTLAQQTPVIFLDEPTSFLDFGSKVEVMHLLRHLAHSMHKTIFLSTHDLAIALQMSDMLWLMEKGEVYKDINGKTVKHESIITSGTPTDLAQSGHLSQFVNREGITLDPNTLSITINSH